MKAMVSHGVGVSVSQRSYVEKLEGADADGTQTKHRRMSKHRETSSEATQTAALAHNTTGNAFRAPLIRPQ